MSKKVADSKVEAKEEIKVADSKIETLAIKTEKTKVEKIETTEVIAVEPVLAVQGGNIKKSSSLINSLKAASILIIIAVVSVLILSICNNFFPEYVPKLDLKTIEIIYKIAPAGEGISPQTALDEGYYIIDNEIDLVKFNKANGSSTDKVLAVYKTLKGLSEGTIIVETQTSGYNDGIVLLTAFKDGVITGLNFRKESENPPNEGVGVFYPSNFEKIAAAVIGKTSFTYAQIQDITSTGATASAKGVANNISLSAKLYEEIIAAGQEV